MLPTPHAQAPAPPMRSAVTALAWAMIVLAAAATGLRVADAVPGAVLGTARGVTPYGTLPALERAVARRLPVPAYYPSSLAWPPDAQFAYLDGAAAYWCSFGAARGLALVIATSARPLAPVAAQVLPAASVLQEGDGVMHGRAARVSRLRDADGALWQQIEWADARGRVLVRYRGTLDELMRIAGSLKE